LSGSTKRFKGSLQEKSSNGDDAVTLTEGLEAYLHNLERSHYSTQTTKSYRHLIDFFIKWVSSKSEALTLHDIDQDTIFEYCDHLAAIEKTKQSESYRIDRIRSLRRLFRYLKKSKVILLDPCEGLGEIKDGFSLPKKLLSKEELERVFSCCDLSKADENLWYTVMITAFAGGLRRKELMNLNIYDLNLRESTIRVNEGKGSKDRVVPVGKRCRIALKEYLETVRSKRAKARGVDAMFIGKNGMPLSYQSIGAIFKRVGKKAGVPHLHCHLMRHQSAVELVRGGMSIRYVQAFLAHAHLKTSQVYTCLVPSDIKKAHEKADLRKKMDIDETTELRKGKNNVVFFNKKPPKGKK
jgi:integrase/recombinase XerD